MLWVAPACCRPEEQTGTARRIGHSRLIPATLDTTNITPSPAHFILPTLSLINQLTRAAKMFEVARRS